MLTLYWWGYGHRGLTLLVFLLVQFFLHEARHLLVQHFLVGVVVSLFTEDFRVDEVIKRAIFLKKLLVVQEILARKHSLEQPSPLILILCLFEDILLFFTRLNLTIPKACAILLPSIAVVLLHQEFCILGSRLQSWLLCQISAPVLRDTSLVRVGVSVGCNRILLWLLVLFWPFVEVHNTAQ